MNALGKRLSGRTKNSSPYIPRVDDSSVGTPKSMRALVCLLLGALLSLLGALTTSMHVRADTGFLYAYRNPQTRLDAMVANGDGEAYAQIARDPLMRNLEGFDSPNEKQAEYRLSRPLWGWLIYAFSFGQRGWTFAAMFILEWLSIAWLVYLVSLWGWWSLPILLLPGILSAAKTLTPEPFGMALALTGWFPLIGLVRETYLLFPLAAFLKTRKRKYLIPFAVWGAWQAVVYLRGARESPSGLLNLPLQGFLHTVPGWGIQDWYALMLLIVLGVLAFKRFPVEAALFSCLALVARADSWARYLDLGRIMLPLEVLGVIVIARMLSERDSKPTEPIYAASSLGDNNL